MKGQNSSSARLSVRETVQRLILDEVLDKSTSAGTQWKILILDEISTKTVSSSLTMFDIMEHNVSLVENLSLGRQPFKDMDAVYFVTPTIEAAERLNADFLTKETARGLKQHDGSPAVPVARYGRVHLVFTGTVDKSVMDMIQANDLLLSRIKTFKEVHFDFVAPESWVYHVSMSDALPRIFTRQLDTNYVTAIARKLYTVCVTLNEFPNIRYQASSSIARTIAQLLNQYLTTYKNNNRKFVPYGEDTSNDRERGILLIVDRVFDPLTPLMHEYTYQSMANDLLELDEDGKISYETTTERGDRTEKKALLNSETDELWVEHRHKHIARVISSLKERMDDILQTNAGAKLVKKKGADADMTAMASAVRNLPQYQQLMSDLGRHVAIASLCMREFGNQNLIEVSAVEQTLSTGVNDNGVEVRGRQAVDLLVNFFNTHPGMLKDLKIRLLLIFFVTQRPISTEDRKAVVGASKLNNSDQDVLANMAFLLDNYNYDADHQASNTNNNNNPVSTAAASKGGFFSSLFGRGAREAEKIASTAEGDYTDTRHVSSLRLLIDQTLNGQLPNDKFASLGPAPPAPRSKDNGQSARKFTGGNRWDNNRSKALQGGRVLAFIAGGICYGEMRDGYEVMAKENREVVVGGTHIITAQDYINDLQQLVRR